MVPNLALRYVDLDQGSTLFCTVWGRAMARRRKNNRKKLGAPVLHCLNPNAAGVDVGATEIYIAVPVDRDPQPVRHFSTFTEDPHAVATWLKGLGSGSVRTTGLAGGKCCRSKPGRSRTEPQRHSAWPLKHFIAVNPISGTFIAACALNSELPRRSPLRPTNWRASSITWSLWDRPTTKPSVPRTKYNTAYVWKLDFVNERVRFQLVLANIAV